ncbi:MAG: DNA integrity scanning protein DisA nucleotide-binding domain protein [Candidatus Aenigmatarchaeota archaeon]
MLERFLSDTASEIAKETETSCVVFLRKKESEEEEEVTISLRIVRETEDKIIRSKKTLKVKRLPPTSITQIREILVEAVNEGFLCQGDKVFCITDESLGKGFEGLFLIFEIDDEFIKETTRGLEEDVDRAVLEAVLNVSREIATEGREGKTIGTGFIIGDHEKILEHGRQLVINPFTGSPLDKRNVSDPEINETIKEFAQIDGVFVLDDKGFVRTAGTYLNIDTSEVEFPGLGARHHSCAAMTQRLDCISVCVSESGTVRLFRDGKIILEERVR